MKNRRIVLGRHFSLRLGTVGLAQSVSSPHDSWRCTRVLSAVTGDGGVAVVVPGKVGRRGSHWRWPVTVGRRKRLSEGFNESYS
jgi:hypothetical protein